MAGLSLSLDHILLPKQVTDGFYSTWNTYHSEIFPSPKTPVKPKYRPLSKIISNSNENITQSLPDLVEWNKFSEEELNGLLKHRVGDDIDKFIQENRRQMYNNNIDDDVKTKLERRSVLFPLPSGHETSKTYQGKSSCSSDQEPTTRTESPSKDKRTNRFSWCGVTTSKFVPNISTGGRKKIYEVIDDTYSADNYVLGS